ncbi:GntR family transcriptional regulator [Roseimaritima ulvae]|uniref:HTH-type transcriptional repressor YtrA n=1 Tax=Roseimaritima ulvae TaxID=980254 RepID=A0A5B9QL70_9BACT|nr:GntR family transcriptional regulator [Roseimaritima ulvae]QEG39674.1 HTH-type transcriptional repressor YtrA [Roseimaritima ulvae]
MFFFIDHSNGVPIYEQLVRQVKYAVADGVLSSGQMIPSVRQLAQQLAINPNTIARAYGQLQTEQVLEPLRGRGLVVRKDARSRCVKARSTLLAARLRSALEECLQSGLSREELTELFQTELAALP